MKPLFRISFLCFLLLMPQLSQAQQADTAVVNPIKRAARAAYFAGELEKNISLTDSLIAVLESYGDYHDYVVYSLFNGWTIHQQLSDIERSGFYANQALQAVETKLDGQHEFLYDLYGLMSGNAESLGNYEKAIEFHEKAMEVAIASQGPYQFGACAAHINIGTLRMELKEFDKAIEHFQAARYITSLRVPEDSTGKWAFRAAMVNVRLLRLNLFLQEVDSAAVYARLCERQLASADPEHLQRSSADMIHSLMDYYQANDQEALAWEYLMDLDTIYYSFNGPKSVKFALNQRTKSEMYQLRNDAESALAANTDAFEILGAQWQEDPLRITEETADLRCTGCEPSLYAQRVELLLTLAEESREENVTAYLTACIHTAELAIDQLASIRRTILFREGSKQVLFEQYNKIYQLGSLAAFHLYQNTGDPEAIAKSLWFSEQSKANLLRESLFVKEVRAQFPLPPDLEAMERSHILRILRLEGKLERAYQTEDSLLASQLSNDSLFLARQDYESFLIDLREAYPIHTRLQTESQVASLNELQGQLGPQERILSYLAIPDRNQFLVTSIGAQEASFRLLDWTSEDEALLDSYVRSLSMVSMVQTRKRQRFSERSHALYQALLAPFVEDLPAETRLIILPDGNLSQLPFESLITSPSDQSFEKLPFLINAHPISYHYAGTTWLSGAMELQPQSGGLLAFAPVFADQTNLAMASQTRGRIQAEAFSEDQGAWTPLPYTKTEVSEIGELFPQDAVTSLIDQAATESALHRSLLQPHQVIHLASHSFVNRQNPQFSGIACARTAGTDDSDNILFASEIFAMNLNADLVVLSSCESGVGPLLAGEGMVGLNRSFLQAGVPNLVFSLWKVDDLATSQLMVRFYEEFLSGKSYAEALRTAKLSLLESPETALPAYWASFMMIGS